jgi:RNA polymerase sigma factor (sigma-70 family)
MQNFHQIGKKFLRRFDPIQREPRRNRMLVAHEPIMDTAGSHGEITRVTKAYGQTPRKAVIVNKADDAEKWVELLRAVRDRQDQSAFAALFAHFAPRVKAFLIRSGMDAAQAEECTQEVMAALWTKAHLFDPARASVSTWIYTIARNRRIDLARRNRRPEPEDLPWGPEAEPDQEDVLLLQQESENLGRAIATLPEKQRDLIEKAFYGDLSHSEIAEITGLPLGTIKSRIRLALDRLRHALA